MSLECPKCLSAMQPVTHGDVTVDRCPACGGLWFDIMEHRHLREAAGSETIDRGSPEQGARTNEQRRVVCPKCGTQMTHQRDVDDRSIEYEYCSVCNGAFFDAGEFARYRDEGFLASLRGLFRR